MLISDVVKLAKSRFSLLLTKEKEIEGLLAQSLSTYQELAGCMRSQVITAYDKEGFLLPQQCLAIAMVKDHYGDYVPHLLFDDETGVQKLFIDGKAKFPLVAEYFVNLLYYADKPDLHIPNRIAGLIIDYLACLISIDNSDRIAKAETAGKMDSSRTPSAMDYTAAKTALEEQFRMHRCIVPMCSILPMG